MSSGDPVVKVVRVMPPTASFAFLSRIAGGSTPAESYSVWSFPDAAAAYLDLLCALDGYDGGGLTLRLGWGASVATNNAVWQAAIRRIQSDADDMDTAHTYDFNTVTGAAPTAIGEVNYNEITFTNGADMDSWADRELAIVRLLRDPANASDTLAGTAFLWGMFGRET